MRNTHCSDGPPFLRLTYRVQNSIAEHCHLATTYSDGQRVAARPVVIYGELSVMSHYEYKLRRSIYKKVRTSAPLTSLCGEDPKDEVMEYKLGVPAACVAVFVYALLRRRRRLSAIRDVPGPANPSWIFGMFLEACFTLS